MNDDERLDVPQAEDTAHDSVDLHNAVSFLGLVFLLEHSQTKSNKQVGPSPEAQVTTKSKEASLSRRAAEPLVGEVFGGKSEENGVGEELASGQADGLSGTGVR